MGLSNLGIFHTLIGIIAIFAGLFSFVKFGKIKLGATAGKIYFYTTLVSALTALGLTKHGFNPGHVLSLVVVASVCLAYFLFARKPQVKTARYWENLLLSFSFFLSMIPTVNETLTRIPVGHPIAASPKDPVVAVSLGVVLLLFAAGSVYQFFSQRKINRID